MNDVVHIEPLNDLEPHDTVTRFCKCQPRVERDGLGILVIHNSYDGRELLEPDRVNKFES